MTLAIIVHGGAKTITEDKVEANHAGCLAAVEAGWAVLTAGGSAGEAVEAAIRVLESDPTFNAGFGSTLNDRQGRVGWRYNSQDMAVAYITANMDKPAVFTNKEAESLENRQEVSMPDGNGKHGSPQDVQS
ncbi:MAG TPA: isoaspartyl peptidase/L-asparaginase [Allocoleopsis sp.]